VKSANPERVLIEQVYGVLRDESDSSGTVDLPADDIARRIPGKITGRDVEGALRVLAKAGAYLSEPEDGGRVYVRLLATPDRIRRELTTDPMDIGLLRAIWRAGGKAFEDGTTVDLQGLPPGFGGVMGAVPILDRLQAGQFLEWRRAGGGRRLADRSRALDAYPIDWAILDRRRKADLAKLDTMQQYAYTKTCRRAFVLRYFGDPAARATCAGCDNCLGTHQTARRARTEAPARQRRGRESQGAETERRADRERAAAAEPALAGADAALFGRLRSLRTQIAREEQVPPYVVFADRTLAEMAHRRPTTEHALGSIKGIGPVKLGRYGARFLEVLNAATETEAA
jgi:ATP-dependent DNA helicase RecQ